MNLLIKYNGRLDKKRMLKYALQEKLVEMKADLSEQAKRYGAKVDEFFVTQGGTR